MKEKEEVRKNIRASKREGVLQNDDFYTCHASYTQEFTEATVTCAKPIRGQASQVSILGRGGLPEVPPLAGELLAVDGG